MRNKCMLANFLAPLIESHVQSELVEGVVVLHGPSGKRADIDVYKERERFLGYIARREKSSRSRASGGTRGAG